MGFWDKLSKMLDMGPQGSGCIAKHRDFTAVPPPPPPMKLKESAKDISEPVLSLVETIRNGEWEYKVIRSGSTYMQTVHEAQHVWLGHKLKFGTKYSSDMIEYGWSIYCLEDWMTEAEQNLVRDEMFKANDVRNDNFGKLRNKREREKFMVFVNADYNKEKQ